MICCHGHQHSRNVSEKTSNIYPGCKSSPLHVKVHAMERLHCAGASRNIISESALGAIHGYSRGNPRLIDNLMTDALTLGAQQECQVIDDEIILAAVNNQNF